eukprot:gene7195-11584_t
MSGGAARLIDLDGEGFHNDEDAAAAAADDDAYAGGSAVATPGGSRVTFRDEGGGSGTLEDVQSFDNTLPVEALTTAAGTSSTGAGSRRKGRRNRRSGRPVQVDRAKLMRKLYISHFLSAWGDRMFEFAVGLLLINVWPDTLLLVAFYGLVGSVGNVLGGAPVGEWVDRGDRLMVVRRALMVANGTVVFSAVLLGMLLKRQEATDETATPERDGIFWLMVTLVVISGAISNLGSLASTLAVEKDWVKVICKDDSETLANTNSVMRRIDLVCKVVAPILVGIILSSFGAKAGATFIVVWNCISVFPEFYALHNVYSSFPELHNKATARATTATGDGDADADSSSDGGATSQAATCWSLVASPFTAMNRGWNTYLEQDVFRPAIALALLYCTVLSFGTVMTAYIYSRGMSEAKLAYARGGGAVFGLISTFIYPQLFKSKGVVGTGGISIWIQFICLSLCVLSTAWADDGDCTEFEFTDVDRFSLCRTQRNRELGLLLTGVIVSRVGLWMFDLAVSQLLQERVKDHELGLVNGVQSSIQNLLDMLGYILSLIINEPADFKWLVYLSVGFVGGAVAMYSTFWKGTSDAANRAAGLPAPSARGKHRRERGRSGHNPSVGSDGAGCSDGVDELQMNLLPRIDDDEDILDRDEDRLLSEVGLNGASYSAGTNADADAGSSSVQNLSSDI